MPKTWVKNFSEFLGLRRQDLDMAEMRQIHVGSVTCRS